MGHAFGSEIKKDTETFYFTMLTKIYEYHTSVQRYFEHQTNLSDLFIWLQLHTIPMFKYCKKVFQLNFKNVQLHECIFLTI